MDFERIEKQLFEVAAFMDGLTAEIPKVDFIKDYKEIKIKIVKRENYNIGNFKRLLQFVDVCNMFSLSFEVRRVEINRGKKLSSE